jgi:hypothetical protein
MRILLYSPVGSLKCKQGWTTSPAFPRGESQAKECDRDISPHVNIQTAARI